MVKGNTGNVLHWSRFVMAVLALLIAAGHLAYTIPLSSSSFPMHLPTNQTNQTQAHIPSSGFNSFNMLGFWFDIEVIAYTIIAVIFLLGIRTWYIPSVLFNILNMCLYFFLFPSHFNIMPGLSTINIIVIGWVLFLIIGLLMLKYDPGSELNKLLITRKS